MADNRTHRGSNINLKAIAKRINPNLKVGFKQPSRKTVGANGRPL